MNSYSCAIGLLVGAVLFVGCGKVQEMAQTAGDAAKTAVEQAKATSKPATPAPANSPAPPATATTDKPTIDPQKMVREFLALSPGEITDAHLAGLRDLGSAAEAITVVDLNANTIITNDGIAHLAGLTNLSKLDLENTAVNADGLAPLKSLPHLTWLNLSNNQGVDDRAAEVLGGFDHLTFLALGSDPISNEGLKHVSKIRTLTELDLSGVTSCTGPGLAAIAALPALKSLNLSNCSSMPELPQGFLELTRCKSLRQLDLSLCNLQDQHMVVFRSWPGLENLNVMNNPLSDQVMTYIKQLGDLKELNVALTRIGNQGLSQLGNRQLESLDISATGVDDAGMQLIKRYPGLKRLNLAQTSVTDQGMPQLKGMKNLEELNLSQTQVGDRGLSELAGLKTLKVLRTEKSSITEEGRTGIAQAIPGLKVDPNE